MARVVFPVGGNGSCAGHDRNFLDFFLSLQDLLVGQVFFSDLPGAFRSH